MNFIHCWQLQSSAHGKKGFIYTYTILDSELDVMTQKRDFGVIVDSSLKMWAQYAAATKTDNKMLGIVKKQIENKMENTIIPLHKTMIHPHLECCVQFCSLHLKKGVVQLDKVQRKATKVIRSMVLLP